MTHQQEVHARLVAGAVIIGALVTAFFIVICGGAP
jgi:hypothetical protein